MKSLLKQIWPILCIAALLMAPACIDDSLRDGSDRNSQTDDDKDNDIDNPGVVRVVTDPEAALAAANCIMVKPGQKSTPHCKGIRRMGSVQRPARQSRHDQRHGADTGLELPR